MVVWTIIRLDVFFAHYLSYYICILIKIKVLVFLNYNKYENHSLLSYFRLSMSIVNFSQKKKKKIWFPLSFEAIDFCL